MGEHVGTDMFRVMDITIQRKRGTFAAFVRIVSEILSPLSAFFESTKHDYTRFNYLGEWHSHHSFALEPSGTDHQTMHGMVTDAQLGANFVVLLLVKLDANKNLGARTTVYLPAKQPFVADTVHESAISISP